MVVSESVSFSELSGLKVGNSILTLVLVSLELELELSSSVLLLSSSSSSKSASKSSLAELAELPPAPPFPWIAVRRTVGPRTRITWEIILFACSSICYKIIYTVLMGFDGSLFIAF